MPGLNQLKQFTEDMREIGDEVKIRASRGEKVAPLPLPKGISEADDSNDFIIGLPTKENIEALSETPQQEEDLYANADISSILGENTDTSLDSILNPTVSADDDDLAEFLNDSPSLTEDLSPLPEETADAESNEEPQKEETPLEDMDLASLLGDAGNLDAPDDFGTEEKPVEEEKPAAEEKSDIEEESGEEINLNDDIPESILENDGTPPASQATEEPKSEDTFDLSGLGDLGNLDENAGFDDLSESNESEKLDLGNFDIDSMISGDEPSSSEEAGSEPAVDSEPSAESTAVDEDFAATPADLGEGGSSSESGLNLGNLDLDAMMSGDDFPMMDDTSSEGGEIPNASDDVPGEEEVPLDSFNPSEFDASAMEGVEFGPPASGDEFQPTDDALAANDDFVLDDNFEIPGFSNTETADLGKKKPLLDTVDFSQGKEDRPKNSLTDEEYALFKKNLSNYPLNLRIAIEDFIARDEFTDEVVFEVIEKVLKKTSARQLATHLEKILDVSISIPRDFEHRSFAEYEAYKQSFQYQLKNRIIPAAIVGVILAFVCFGLFKAGQHFIYKPVMANIHYKQGYTLLEASEFPQSEEEFKEAVSYRPVKKWFFKYAQGYRAKKQYERAGNMYRNTLLFFDHDKQAGLEWAEMELYDRANYEKAEEITRREVLDYHINDADGILLLGDIFLEWAEVDESKYELAKQQYLDLMQRYGQNNVYLSRMLRYYIRTDKLREVLTYKNMLYMPGNDRQNLKTLEARDWTELSGYLLEKLYGVLSKNDEYLRSSIEDVLAMLNLAVKADSRNPVARYNLARYFIQNGNTEQAKIELERSLDLFNAISVRTKKNVYREINATRTLGELYASNKEYIKAQEVYTRGINLYNEEHENSELEGDSNTGRLFADMGDLDYFISGDVDDALYNYEMAIQTKNDTPSINYRVGAIYYNKKNYDNALASFLKVSEKEPGNFNLLLSLGNVLSLRGDNFAAESYYSDLLRKLDNSRDTSKYLLPQQDADDFEMVDLYLKANNNLGVTLHRLARQTGDSNKNAESMVRLQDSMRAYDALTRNQQTMVRLEGSNLAAQNSKYITHPLPDFEPAIYTDIPRLLTGEKALE